MLGCEPTVSLCNPNRSINSPTKSFLTLPSMKIVHVSILTTAICFSSWICHFFVLGGCHWPMADALSTGPKMVGTASHARRPSPPYKAIIFDIDGTLADSFQLGFDATAQVLARHQIPPITAEVYHAHTRYATPDRLARHAGWQPGHDDDEDDAAYKSIGLALAREFDDLYIGLVSMQTAAFFPGMADLIMRKIPDTVLLGAFTNAAVRYAHAVLECNSQHVATTSAVTTPITSADRCSPASFVSLYDRFRSIRGADNVPAPKPAPDGLLTVCQDLGGVNPQDCVYVGDSPSDAIAAKAAGMAAIGVLWGSHNRASLEQAPFDTLCETVTELERLLVAPSSEHPAVGSAAPQ